ncbi:MAG TPA: PTS sugar transporter subunit IIA [Chlamydiales bacterium]|nr:PTS sugar transporter subunit IIA [Chlamydiales bacterium]
MLEKDLVKNCLENISISFLREKERHLVLKELVNQLSQAKKVSCATKFYDALVEREKILSTGIGMGLAIPHAKLDCFNSFFCTVGIQKEKGIEWNSIDRSPVRIVVMIGGPDKNKMEYLQILSKLTKAFRDSKLRKGLIDAANEQEAQQLLKKYLTN